MANFSGLRILLLLPLLLTASCRTHREATSVLYEAEADTLRRDSLSLALEWASDHTARQATLRLDTAWLQAHLLLFSDPDSVGRQHLRAAARVDYSSRCSRQTRRTEGEAATTRLAATAASVDSASRSTSLVRKEAAEKSALRPASRRLLLCTLAALALLGGLCYLKYKTIP